jgi:hypothetical protein
MNRKKNSSFLIAIVSLLFLFVGVYLVFLLKNSDSLIIPKDWKKYNDADIDFGIKTTVSLPPGCIFNFTGSEWDLRCGEKDVWDYKTSVFRGKEDKLKNYYTDGSLEQWYKKYLNGDFFADYASQEKNIILKTIKHSIQSNNYFELTIKETNGQIITHYLYLQNNVVHIIQPLIINESTSMIKKNIGIIFTSLESSITK